MKCLSVVLNVFIVTLLGASTYVDNEGVIRWKQTEAEVCAFGTNYSVPFSYWDWRKPLDVDHRQAIDEDVYHIARLGLDGYRIHVWNTMISDKAGNLTYNQHFALFDYLLFKLKQRKIKLFITPQKSISVTNPASWAAQANYLAQFVTHVNPYTGIAYQDDPDVIAFEIMNEPHHFKRPDLVTVYIDQMIDAIKGTGCDKPLFYNMTTCAQQIDQVLTSKIEGGTFQWYPTGLTSNHDQKGNLLPNVDRYHIPFADRLTGQRPKAIYEFSPSDTASAVMYPAMARSFREAGFQFAAQFAYDPLHAAYCNIEYRTHFLNLAYTPKKAFGLMIAAEVFRRVPLGNSYGRFPENNQFDAFRLSYEEDLAEMVTADRFLYSNDTQTVPPSPDRLVQIAGTGSSSVVTYAGTGAYFLDQLEAGVWRLEVMPDAVWVRDPFFVVDIQREVAVVQWHDRRMTIDLPDLGSDFTVVGINHGNDAQSKAQRKAFTVTPGCYLLTRAGQSSNWQAKDAWNNTHLGEFHAPQRQQKRDYVLHTPPDEITIGTALTLTTQVVTRQAPDKVELVLLGVGGGKVLPMAPNAAFGYTVTIPAIYLVKPGLLRYYISVKAGGRFLTYPDGSAGSFVLKRRTYVGDRILDDAAPYTIRIVVPDQPVTLFDAARDWQALTKMDRKDRIDCVPAPIPGKQLMQLRVGSFHRSKEEVTVRSYCRKRIVDRRQDLSGKQRITIYGQSLNDSDCSLQIALLTTTGHAFGTNLTLSPALRSYYVDIKDLRPTESVLLPRPYPEFQRYRFATADDVALDLSQVESSQLLIELEDMGQKRNRTQGMAIGWIQLQ